MKLAVPKLKVECLRPKEIEKYDYERIKLSLNEKFSKYRDYKERLDIIASRIESGLSNDNDIAEIMHLYKNSYFQRKRCCSNYFR